MNNFVFPAVFFYLTMYSFSACDVLPDAGLDKIANFSTHIVGGRESRVFTEPKRADPSDICLACFYVYFTLIGVHWAKNNFIVFAPLLPS
jgi:hypothetical protein